MRNAVIAGVLAVAGFLTGGSLWFGVAAVFLGDVALSVAQRAGL